MHGCCLEGGGGFSVRGPTWSPDGTRILLLGESGDQILMIDPTTGERTRGAVPFAAAIAWRPAQP